MIAALSALLLASPAGAIDPAGARYIDDTDGIFWFLQISDTHVGAELGYGSQDTDNLAWVLEAADTVIFPELIVCTGDLVDATNGYLIPSGQYQEEWDQYNEVLAGRAVTFFHDLPGNHDTYFDEGATHYLGNALIGSAYGVWHEAWSHAFPYGEYLFVGLNSADTSGAWAGFDSPGVDSEERALLEESLVAWGDARLAFVFTHHPLDDLEQGGDELVARLEAGGVSAWAAGHVHSPAEEQRGSTLHTVLDSAGKSDHQNLGIWAVDHDGVAYRAVDIGAWPMALITAPVDAALGGGNPWAYPVSLHHDANPVRALVFDPEPPVSVYFRVDGGESVAMEELEPGIWQGLWDATGHAEGEHVISVQVISTSGSDSDEVTVSLAVTECDDGVDNDGNGYADHEEDGGCWGPSDDDESGWSAPLDTGDPDSAPPDSGSPDSDAPGDSADSAGETGESARPADSGEGPGLDTPGRCGCGAAAGARGLWGLPAVLLLGIRRRRRGAPPAAAAP